MEIDENRRCRNCNHFPCTKVESLNGVCENHEYESEEIRKEKIKNAKLENDLEKSNKYKILYESALVTLNEKEKREKENIDTIENYRKRLEAKDNEIFSLNDTINNYRLIENEISNKEKELSKTIIETKNDAKNEIKNKIIDKVLNLKGNISKSKMCDLIEKIEESN